MKMAFKDNYLKHLTWVQ